MDPSRAHPKRPYYVTKETKVRFVRLEKKTRKFFRKTARRRSAAARSAAASCKVLSSFRFNRPERCRVLCPNDTCDRCVISVICFACRAIGIPAIISRYCHPINSDAMSSAPPPPCARICQFSFFGSIPWNRRRLFRHTSHRSPVHRPDVCCWYLCQTYHEFEWHRPLGSCGPVPPATFALPRKRPL